jgi:protein involved in polysaccharide export with SLBB domain
VIPIRGLAGVLLIQALALSAPAGAQTTDPTADPRELRGRTGLPIEPRSVAPVAGPVNAATYVVGPGDVLRVVLSGPVVREITAEVGPEGSALIPEYGTVKVAGLTLQAARQEIRRAVGASLRRDVRIDVDLARVRLLRVFVVGEANAGPLELPATVRASEALQGGSLLAAGGSRRNIELRHRDGQVERVDLDRYVRLGDERANPAVRDDDVLFVPPAREFVYANGAVVHDGRYELAPEDSLSGLLALAGGPTTSARTENALFVHWVTPGTRESSWVSLDDIRGGSFNPRLTDGDRLLVYHLPEYHRFESASILGEVISPGVYPLTPGRSKLSDLVRAAGGFQPRADLSAIRVYRPRLGASEADPELDRLSRLSRNELTSSEYEILRTRLTQRRADFRVDWNRLARVPETDVLLADGDVVRVDATVATVRVEGQVRRPGLLRYDPGASINRYVQDAGGFSARAARSQTLVTRAVTGQTLPAREVGSIAPGDLIWVPERPDRTLWQNLGTLIAVAAQVATVVIAVRR